eukprot:m51a1_g6 hypothetical protein (262) ;mRNA; f:28520-29584
MQNPSIEAAAGVPPMPMACDSVPQQASTNPESSQPPRIWASNSKIYLSSPFKVTFVAGLSWMSQNGVTETLVRNLAGRAKLLLEGKEDCTGQGAIPPCARCCSKRGANVTLGFAPQEGSSSESTSPATGEECVIEFDYCRSHCNSSRLHLGGRVMIMLEVFDVHGNVVARPVTQPLMLCSKPSIHSSPMGLPLHPAPITTPLSLNLSDALAAAQMSRFAGGEVESNTSTEEPLYKKLMELEADIYSQLVKVQFVKLLLQSQ